MITIWILVLLIFILTFTYHWKRRYLYFLANKLPGPVALPIIGNGLTFLCSTEDILKTITTLVSFYPKPLRFWFGPTLVIYFSDPHHIEKILSSNKLAYKHDIYDQIIKIYLGDGLVSNSGPKYKKHRRLIQPLINLKFVTGNFKKFQKHIDILLEKFNSHADGKVFDIHDLIHFCLADIIGESVLGTKIEAQSGKNIDYVHATADMYEVGYSRIMRPWLHPDIFYNLTEEKKHQTFIVETTTTFIKNIVEKARGRLKTSQYSVTEDCPIIDQIADIISKDPSAMNEEDFLYHMYTLYVASEDTLTIIASMLCVCLGMYPEYQALAAEEIRAIFGDTPRDITYDDITKMQYLDMCIRDVLRLIPIAPIILRRTIEDTQIGDLVYPKGCGIMVSIFDVHRDPKYWDYPGEFYPNHFLPEKVTNRHPFAFVPFSAGPRSCVGKVLAMTGLKFIIANVLQRFEIMSDGKFPDVVLKSDITVRSASGYRVSLKRRKWK